MGRYAWLFRHLARSRLFAVSYFTEGGCAAMTPQEKINLWMNIAVLLSIVGVMTFLSCLGSTTFWGDD
jgi:hypothetical protein